jgi:hypothetical protein
MTNLFQSVFRSRREDCDNAAETGTAPLLRLSEHREDIWTIKDSFSGTLVTGETGSGKSSGSGAALARAFLRHGYGGMVCCCKADEAENWKRYCAETNREDSLVVVGPEHPWRFNFLNYELTRPGRGSGQTENIVSLFTDTIETLERRDGGSRQDPYWDRALKQLLRNSVDLLSISRGHIRMAELHELITSAAQSPEQLRSESWQKNSFCMKCIREAETREKSEQQRHDFAVSARFWMSEYPLLSDRTRSCIVSTFTSLADVLLRGLAYELVCGRTTMAPEMAHEGAIIILDIPLKQFDVVGLTIQTIFKLLFQRSVERRDLGKHGRPVFLWIDECQWFLCKSDPLFQTTARCARCASVLLTQNIGNLHAAIGKSGTDTLVGNLSTKFIHCNTDAATNEWASNLFARTYRYRTSSGSSTREDDTGRGTTSHNTGGHEALEHQVLPIEFSSLRKGGTENDRCVDAFVFQGGRQWKATGKNHLRVAFKQG